MISFGSMVYPREQLILSIGFKVGFIEFLEYHVRIHYWVFFFYAWLPSMLAFIMEKNDKENKTSKGKK